MEVLHCLPRHICISVQLSLDHCGLYDFPLSQQALSVPPSATFSIVSTGECIRSGRMSLKLAVCTVHLTDVPTSSAATSITRSKMTGEDVLSLKALHGNEESIKVEHCSDCSMCSPAGMCEIKGIASLRGWVHQKIDVK